MLGIFKRISQMFCRHNVVRVIRYNKNCVPDDWRGKLLYVDRLDVHNFVQCSCCERVLYVDQRERLFEDSTSEAVLAVTQTPSAERLRAITSGRTP